MFNFVEKNQVLIKIILGAVALTFVVVGVESYSAIADEPYLAKVGDVKIHVREVERVLEGQPIDVAAKQAALERLISQQLLVAAAAKTGVNPGDAELQRAILAIPAFQDGGKFSQQRYTEFINARYRNVADFEQDIRRDLRIQTQAMAFSGTHFISKSVTGRLGEMMGETRTVAEWSLPVQSFASQVKLDDAEVKKYYEANKARFVSAESADIEYVLLSLADLASQQQVSDEEAKQYFDKNTAEFGEEERKVAHILIAADASASKEAKAKARAKADSLLVQLKANPALFADIARKESQDPGSAEQGGDLGYVSRGSMVKPFEDAAFSLPKGALSGVVESEFGYHILRLDDVKAQDFAAVKPGVIEKLKRQKASALYRSQLEKAGDLAYQQPNSLQPLLLALKVSAQTAAAVGRTGVAGDKLLSNQKLLDAVFTDDVLLKKHNSEVVEIDSSTAAVVRVKSYHPKRQKTLDQVSASIVAELTAREAARLAEKRGQTLLAELKAGKSVDGVKWSAVRTMSRSANDAAGAGVIRAVFAADTGKFPSFAAARAANGDYTVYRVDAVNKGPELPEQAKMQLNNAIGGVLSGEVFSAYLTVLRSQFPVSMGTEK